MISERFLRSVSLSLSLKAYELSTLTGTQVLLLVASETGHVYTFATRKLQPMITSETGKALIQTCLNSPDSPPRSDPSTDQRMSATGFEETDLTYQVSESESLGETKVSSALRCSAWLCLFLLIFYESMNHMKRKNSRVGPKSTG